VTYRVTTETSAYLIDPDARTATRLAGHGSQSGHDGDVMVAELRRDGEPVPIVAISTLVIGQPMVLLLRLREDGSPTLRTTTPIQDISEM
jgi:hypothetical protein